MFNSDDSIYEKNINRNISLCIVFVVLFATEDIDIRFTCRES